MQVGAASNLLSFGDILVILELIRPTVDALSRRRGLLQREVKEYVHDLLGQHITLAYKIFYHLYYQREERRPVADPGQDFLHNITVRPGYNLGLGAVLYYIVYSSRVVATGGDVYVSKLAKRHSSVVGVEALVVALSHVVLMQGVQQLIYGSTVLNSTRVIKAAVQVGEQRVSGSKTSQGGGTGIAKDELLRLDKVQVHGVDLCLRQRVSAPLTSLARPKALLLAMAVRQRAKMHLEPEQTLREIVERRMLVLTGDGEGILLAIILVVGVGVDCDDMPPPELGKLSPRLHVGVGAAPAPNEVMVMPRVTALPLNILIAGMVSLKKVQPFVNGLAPNTEISEDLLLETRATGLDNNVVQLFEKQKNLVPDLANVAGEVADVAAVAVGGALNPMHLNERIYARSHYFLGLCKLWQVVGNVAKAYIVFDSKKGDLIFRAADVLFFAVSTNVLGPVR